MNTQDQTAQQKQSQQGSTQAFMKYFFPLFSLWICASSNAAFAIYWAFVNVVQIAQTFVINKILDHQEKNVISDKEA